MSIRPAPKKLTMSPGITGPAPPACVAAARPATSRRLSPLASRGAPVEMTGTTSCRLAGSPAMSSSKGMLSDRNRRAC